MNRLSLPARQPLRRAPGRSATGLAAFTLIEMLVATAISAVLMGAVLMILASLSRDRRRFDRAVDAVNDRPLVERLRWDLANATTLAQSLDGKTLLLTGHGGIDPATLAPNGRICRVIYRCVVEDRSPLLVRDQFYLDEPVNPRPWRGLVGFGVTRLTATPASADAALVNPTDVDESAGPTPTLAPPTFVASRMRLHWERGESSTDREVWLK